MGAPVGAQKQIFPYGERGENFPPFGHLDESPLDDLVRRQSSQFDTYRNESIPRSA